MTLIVLAADKGSPGVTTSAVALAAIWPRRALFAECDPYGGDLVYRMPADHGGPLDPNRGLVSLAVEARRGLDANILPQHTQRLRGGLEIMVGLGNADQAQGMTGLWSPLGRAFDRFSDLPHGADVIADCGRVGPDSPTLDLLAQAALVLLVARADAEQIAHARDRANSLAARLHGNQIGTVSIARPPIGIVLIAPPGQARSLSKQVGDLLAASTAGAEVLGVIAYDESGAAALSGRARGRVDKALLTRTARELAGTVTSRYGLLRPSPAQPQFPGHPGRPATAPSQADQTATGQFPAFQPPAPIPPQQHVHPQPPQPGQGPARPGQPAQSPYRPPQPPQAPHQQPPRPQPRPQPPGYTTGGEPAEPPTGSSAGNANPYFENPVHTNGDSTTASNPSTTASNLRNVPHPGANSSVA